MDCILYFFENTQLLPILLLQRIINTGTMINLLIFLVLLSDYLDKIANLNVADSFGIIKSNPAIPTFLFVLTNEVY